MTRHNPWPLVPIAILLATVLANVLLVRLAMDGADTRADAPAAEGP